MDGLARMESDDVSDNISTTFRIWTNSHQGWKQIYCIKKEYVQHEYCKNESLGGQRLEEEIA
jgi:hypothetical protein